MDDPTALTDHLLRRAAERLAGHPKRLFLAEVALALCGGSARAAERRFGWGREAVETGLNELRSGIRCVENFVAKGRVPVEQANPQLAADIRDLVEPRTHADPELKSDRRDTDLAAREVLERLRADKGYAAADLPSERTMRDILHRMGYRRTRLRKGKPLKKVAATDAIFANIQAAASRRRPTRPRSRCRWTRRRRWPKGSTPAGGKTRTAADGSAASGWDHDPPAKRKWTPLGLLMLASGVFTLLFGSKETSDFWADGLTRWWEGVKGGLGHIRRLVVYLDNGPNNAGTRTPWLKRVVEFADATGLEVRLVYYPPYHSKYNPVERCWSALEQKWSGGLLTSLDVILGYARRMRWKGHPPTVEALGGEYADGVRLSKAQMKPIEARLERSKTLPKYDIRIRPKRPPAGRIPPAVRLTASSCDKFPDRGIG